MVRYLLIALFLISPLLLARCHNARMDTSNDPSSSTEKAGVTNCSINPSDNNDTLAVISCPDGTTMNIPRNKNGSDGINGTSCTVSQAQDGAMISCEDDSQAFVKNGSDGHSCSVSQVNDYASLIECTDGTQSLIDLNSMTQFYVQEIIDPCGDNPNKFDEVILKFNNGDLLAYFNSPNNKFLTLIPPGTYQTSDEQNCKFKVDSAGNIIEL